MTFSPRTWIDRVDDLDAEALNDLETRISAIDGGGGGTPSGDSPVSANLVTNYGADPTGAVPITTSGSLGPLNDAIADLNAGVIKDLYIPAGNYKLAAIPDPIVPVSVTNGVGTADWITIRGAGPATRLTYTEATAHGTFFTLGGTDGTKAVRFASISDMTLTCNVGPSNAPPASEPAFVLNDGSHMMIYNFIVQNISTLIKVGTTNSNCRVQRYEVHNIFGKFNENSPGGTAIDVVNATDGNFSDIQIVCHNFGGGRGVHNHPGTGINNDQHWFTNVHFQGGMAHWLDIDVTDGTCFNWVFKQCVLDGALDNSIFIHSDAGGVGNCTDVHFLDCHCSSWAGTAIHLQHNGDSGSWRSIQVIGGRYKFMNQRGLYIHGTLASNITSVVCDGVTFLQDRSQVDSVTTNSGSPANTFTTEYSIDGATAGLDNGDVIIFDAGETITGVTAGTEYTVSNVTEYDSTAHPPYGATTFKLTGVTVTGSSGSPVGMFKVKLDGACRFADARGVRIQDCYISGFYGPATQVGYAVQGVSSPVAYHVTGNVAQGMVTGFSSGLTNDTTDPRANIIEGNVSDI